MRYYILIFTVVLIPFFGSSQTVGTVLNEIETSEGYILMHPISFDTTYLINNCGEKINQWPSSFPNGTFAGLRPNGNLVKALLYSGADYFNAGGRTGKIVEQDWSGTDVWEYTLADTNFHLHHDVHILPNGNILAIAWEKKSIAECIAAGRDTTNVPTEGMWPCVVFEIQPIGALSSIVWEWHAWDHLVQDFDPTKANYGDLLLNKSRLNINGGNQNNSADWIHLNGMDYNEDLDMIVLSSPMLNEVFIIDHGTTSAEASTNVGGLYGQGGDLLWRWGNPMNYNAGTASDQQLNFQHDPQWVDRGSVYTNMISIFSNQDMDNGTSVSTAKIIEFPFDTVNSIFPVVNNAFAPDTTFFEYQLPTNLFSAHISGLEIQENDNILIASGNHGTYLEIDTNSQVVWNYVVPIKVNGQFAAQGDTGLNLKRIYQPVKYPLGFPGFVGHDMSPTSPIELNPLPCNTSSALEEISANNFSVYPNPAIDNLIVRSKSEEVLHGRLVSSSGQLVKEFDISKGENHISSDNLVIGVYYLHIEDVWIKVIFN